MSVILFTNFGFIVRCHSIMISALSNNKSISGDFVNKPVFTIDAPGPVSRPMMLKRFRVS